MRDGVKTIALCGDHRFDACGGGSGCSRLRHALRSCRAGIGLRAGERAHNLRCGAFFRFEDKRALGADAPGRASSTSFHATKLFSTVEGGAVFVPGPADKVLCDRLRIRNRQSGRCRTFRHQHEDERITRRFRPVGAGRRRRGNRRQGAHSRGLQIPPRATRRYRHREQGEGFEPNWSHFAIRVDEKAADMSRDALFTRLGEFNIHCRKYFNPLTTRIPLYAGLPSAAPENRRTRTVSSVRPCARRFMKIRALTLPSPPQFTRSWGAPTGFDAKKYALPPRAKK